MQFSTLPVPDGAAAFARMAILGSVDTVRAQTAQLGFFAPAFGYLDELFRPGSAAGERLRALPDGETHRVELAGGCFALEQAYATRVRADGFFESHLKYIDVQVLFEGEETMEVADAAHMTVRQVYNEKRDLIVYADSSAASLLRVRVGMAAVFSPADVHMPTLRTGDAAVTVRKVVVKVPVPV